MASLLRRGLLQQLTVKPCQFLPYRPIHTSLPRRSDALFVVTSRFAFPETDLTAPRLAREQPKYPVLLHSREHETSPADHQVTY